MPLFLLPSALRWRLPMDRVRRHLRARGARTQLPSPQISAWLQIDKAFLIAQPMRKADWTRRFAAGWGSAGMPMAIVEGNQTVRSALARENDREITPGARSGIATASLGARRYGTIVSLSALQVTLASALRPPNRGYSPSSRVRQLPQWGHRGNSASGSGDRKSTRLNSSHRR